MISDLGRIGHELRNIRENLQQANYGHAAKNLDDLIKEVEGTPLSLITINLQAVRALEQVTEKRIEEEREKLAIDYQRQFEARLKANGLS
jgi:serine kinase of HPr protein (carbohydrate metabolism regulator)